ncbi:MULTISPECIES: DUF2218 domain-containing protein [Acinetobacter]|uniref:DUF2218 domain-containing protein n=2 Tax=Acinetobacter baylyi TaxID=202950 RepID=Q6FEB0_ACIAD|nr:MULTISPECIES: DUF2218 domain-containing protein [Acinetobacter]ENV55811.1 hypothetical protein F952_00439 [Acinetobacter baylyi DSM 14961 = CIP 107474]KAF2371551.1 hypothetical protein BSL88_06480 [Acinetobacter baylyi]KAF2373423.1 hypothetical protein BSL67_10725 [Acinetobacter baylyi]KAF2376731.1 hypothetical protein BSN81_12615 [Acinetobacter baylyi]KAF2381483.1 hypothetical protein BSN83_06975 [Acinetobacter baylyi]
MKTQTSLNTVEARRIAKRLLNHWKHKFEVSESDTEFRIMMPTATVVLTPSEQQLTARIESELEDHTRLEGVVIDHLNRMAQQEFNVTWSQV